jgi:hypothetical protein
MWLKKNEIKLYKDFSIAGETEDSTSWLAQRWWVEANTFFVFGTFRQIT